MEQRIGARRGSEGRPDDRGTATTQEVLTAGQPVWVVIGKYVHPATVNDARERSFNIVHGGAHGYGGTVYQYNVSDEWVSWCRGLRDLPALRAALALL